MIPFDAKLDPRAKVRIGEKRQTRGGGSRPASLDYFVSDDPEIEEMFGQQPRRLPVRLAAETVADVFPTTLEWWGKRDAQRATLICYTKDAKVARRLEAKVTDKDERVGEPHNGRQGIVCRFRQCPDFHTRGCRPMGRLDFFIEGGRQDLPLRFETKSFNTIERILPLLKNLERQGDLRDHVFDLCVEMEKDGEKQYPVVWLEPKAAAVAAPVAAPAPVAGDPANRGQIIALLELHGQDPRDPAIASWIKDVGYDEALAKLRRRFGLD